MKFTSFSRRFVLSAFAVVLLVSSFGFMFPEEVSAQTISCGLDPNYNDYYHGESASLYVGSADLPNFGGGLSINPPSISIPPATPHNPAPPVYDFPTLPNGSDRGLVTGQAQISYYDRNGSPRTAQCSYRYIVRICQSYYPEYAPNATQDIPCTRSGGGGGGGGTTTGFTLTCSPVTRAVNPGQGTSYSVTVTPSPGFSELVYISGSAQAQIQVGSGVINGGGTTIIPVTTPSNISPGAYTVTFTGTSESGIESADSCTLSVNAPVVPYATPYTTPYVTPYTSPLTPDFTLTCAPPSRTINQGDPASYSVAASGSNMGNASVNLTSAILPVAANPPSVSITPTSIGVPGFAVVSVGTTLATNPANYRITIRGESGGLVRTCEVLLDVTNNNQPCPPVCPTPYATPYTTPYATPYSSPPVGGDLSISDKDIIEVNGVPNPNANPGNGIPDVPSKLNFKSGDKVRFKISIVNSGTKPISGISIKDTMLNMQLSPTPNVAFSGCAGSLVSSSPSSVEFKVSGSIDVGKICSAAFTMVIVPPIGATDGIYRFQNRALIEGDIASTTVKTPLLLFIVGKVPIKEEIAP